MQAIGLERISKKENQVRIFSLNRAMKHLRYQKHVYPAASVSCKYWRRRVKHRQVFMFKPPVPFGINCAKLDEFGRFASLNNLISLTCRRICIYLYIIYNNPNPLTCKRICIIQADKFATFPVCYVSAETSQCHSYSSYDSDSYKNIYFYHNLQ